MAHNPDFSQFEERICIVFSDKDLLKQAFIHRSYLNENAHLHLSHNERFEFLGDAVLELAVTDFLYRTYPDKTEGELTALRAALVNTHTLARAAHDLGMENFLLLSRGEEKAGGKARQYILANTFEAVIGAIYLDQKYEKAYDFIALAIFPRVEEIIEKRLWQDSKSFFQEKSQEHVGVTPVYNILAETGPDHDKKFTVGVYISEERIAEGSGRSKQEAEQEAARRALSKKGWD